RSSSYLLETDLVKSFSTGTNLTVGTSYELANVASVGNRHLANWEVGLSQSLWRNFFGRAVRLRRQADEAELQSRRLALLLERQQFLSDLENRFWDLAVAVREREIREANLKRSQELEKWI